MLNLLKSRQKNAGVWHRIGSKVVIYASGRLDSSMMYCKKQGSFVCAETCTTRRRDK